MVQGNGDGPNGLGREHGRRQAWPIGPDHHQVVTPAQTCELQTGRHVQCHIGQVCPGVGLPNAIFFFAHGRGLRSLLGMAHQQLRKRALHLVPSVSALHGRGPSLAASRAHGTGPGLCLLSDCIRDFDIYLSLQRQSREDPDHN